MGWPAATGLWWEIRESPQGGKKQLTKDLSSVASLQFKNYDGIIRGENYAYMNISDINK